MNELLVDSVELAIYADAEAEKRQLLAGDEEQELCGKLSRVDVNSDHTLMKAGADKFGIKYIDSPIGLLFYATDAGAAIGIKNVNMSIKNFTNTEIVPKEQREKYDIKTYREYSNGKRRPDPRIILLTKEGLYRLLSWSRSHRASEVASALGLQVGYRFTPEESETINYITKAFGCHPHDTQYTVAGLPYRIDLYFHDLKLAVECDENDHKDRDEEYERTREEKITAALGCRFFRYNPREDIFEVIGRLHKMITGAGH